MRISRGMIGITRKDRIINVKIIKISEATLINEKIRINKFR